MVRSVGTIEIKLMDEADEGGVMDFFRGNLETFGDFERFRGWRQKYGSQNRGEGFAIAKDGEKVVGSVGIVPAHVTVNGYPIRATWQQDSLVSSAMRGKGLGKRLVEKGAEGWDLLLAKGTSEAMYGLRKSVGFLDVDSSGYMVRVCKPRGLQTTVKNLIAEYSSLIWKKVVSLPATDPRMVVECIQKFDESFDAIADDLSRQSVIKLRKDHQYLNWRYTACPGKDYKVFKGGANEAVGAVVVRVSGPLRDEGWIVDLICPRDDQKCGYALIRKGIEYLEAQGVYRIWVFSTLPSTRKWFFRFGLVPTKFTPRFTYRAENREIAERIKGAKWDFWHGDGDVELYQ